MMREENSKAAARNAMVSRRMPRYVAAFALLAIAFLFVYGLDMFKYPERLRWIKEYELESHTGTSRIVPGYFGESEAYALGINQDNNLVFKKPQAAIEEFEKDYREALSVIQSSAKLRSFGISSAPSYRDYGKNVLDDTTLTGEKREQIEKAIEFINVYENGIDRNDIMFRLFYVHWS